jgi:hypothetical protein
VNSDVRDMSGPELAVLPPLIVSVPCPADMIEWSITFCPQDFKVPAAVAAGTFECFLIAG